MIIIYMYIKQMKHPIIIMICIWYTGINSTSHFLDGFLLQMFLIFVAAGIKRSKNGTKVILRVPPSNIHPTKHPIIVN